VRPPQDERAVAAGRALAAGHDPDLTRGAGREHAPARLHDLPQRLDGKILRRLLADITDERSWGDTTSLQDESIPHRITSIVSASRVPAGV
jgi:hypothetical protein